MRTGGSGAQWNPYEDKALARIAVDALIQGIERSTSTAHVSCFLSDALLAKMREMSEDDAMEFLRSMVLRDGMAPNPSSTKTRLDLNRTGGDSWILTVAYYDRDIRPGVNHELIHIVLQFEDGAWHIDEWLRDD